MKSLLFIGPSREELKRFPVEVYQNIGYDLYIAQRGGKTINAKPLIGFGGAGVLELIENYHGDTYRAIYTIKFREVVYVLHCFQKKSKQGIRTPKHNLKLIKQRLKMAEFEYLNRYEEGE